MENFKNGSNRDSPQECTYLLPTISYSDNGYYGNTIRTTTTNGDEAVQHRTTALSILQHELHDENLVRQLNVWDLIGIGVGSTVGSGVFVLVGLVASTSSGGQYAWISMLLAGIAATASGICFAELASQLPCTGSTYVYTKYTWGQPAAVIAAACLTLEYGISGAAVARTWGDKILVYIQSYYIQQQQEEATTTFSDIPKTTIISQHDNIIFVSLSSFSSCINYWFQPDKIINIPAGLLSVVATMLLLCGMSRSKKITNIMTIVKMILVVFLIIAGLALYDPNINSISTIQSTASSTERTSSWWIIPALSPPPYGVAGIMKGATVSFFGFLGYDEVCCVAGEAINPTRDIPRAVLGTIAITTACYVLAAIALGNMIPFDEISPTAGFPNAFATRNYPTLASIAGIGELITLPVVVVLCLLAQPRVFYSLSIDGILPTIFRTTDAAGNLQFGTAISGIIMILVATFCPFTYLDNCISAGILLAFSMTNTCLILFRCQYRYSNYNKEQQQQSTKKIDADNCNSNHPTISSNASSSKVLSLYTLLIIYNGLCFVTSIAWSIGSNTEGNTTIITKGQTVVASISTSATIVCYGYLSWHYPSSHEFGGVIWPQHNKKQQAVRNNNNYKVIDTEPSYRSAPLSTSNLSQSSEGACTVVTSSTNGTKKFGTTTIDVINCCTTTRTSQHDPKEDNNSIYYFSTPAVPLIPCLGMAMNWYLFVQAGLVGISFLLLYILLILLLYYSSTIGTTTATTTETNQHPFNSSKENK